MTHSTAHIVPIGQIALIAASSNARKRALTRCLRLSAAGRCRRCCSGIPPWRSSHDTTIALFTDEYQVPLLPPELPLIWLQSIELTTPILLVLGLLTRAAASCCSA